MTKNELRKSLKSIGYNCSFKTQSSPFGGKDITFLYLVLPDGQKILMSSSSVFGKDFYDEHKQVFELINKYMDGLK
jgi:hypothetical protein